MCQAAAIGIELARELSEAGEKDCVAEEHSAAAGQVRENGGGRNRTGEEKDR